MGCPLNVNRFSIGGVIKSWPSSRSAALLAAARKIDKINFQSAPKSNSASIEVLRDSSSWVARVIGVVVANGVSVVSIMRASLENLPLAEYFTVSASMNP